MKSGLEGVIAAETALSHSDADTGTIWLRGHTIEDLVKNHGYEAPSRFCGKALSVRT